MQIFEYGIKTSTIGQDGWIIHNRKYSSNNISKKKWNYDELEKQEKPFIMERIRNYEIVFEKKKL